MSEEPDTPPFSTVDINNDNRDDEDLFASAVQEVSLDSEVNGTRESLDKISINDTPANTGSIGSPVMEEIATERANNIIITITEPQKIGEGMMSSYVAYRVLTKTNMPIFSKHDFAVLRRFSDFLGLYEKLTEKYLRAGRIIPPAPEKSIVGTTKLKMTSTPSTESANGSAAAASVQSQFVERRRAALERFLNRVAQHPVLCIDPDFREFLESEAELPKATSTSALSSAGMLRLFNKVGETVNKITYKMEESDPWFEERSSRMEALEACLRRLCAACEALAGERRELGARAHDAARAAAALSGADPHAPLSRALSHLADLHEKACIQHVSVYMEALAGERRELGARAHDAARAAAALSGADPHAPLSRALSHLADLHEKACIQHVSVYMEALAGERRELGARAHDAARAAAALSGADPHAPLSRALSHLADLHEKACIQHVSVYMEALAGERRELGARAHDAARAAAALSGADPHAPLSRALSHLADLHEKACIQHVSVYMEALAGERRELGARAHDAARAAAALSGADPHAPLSRALSHLADLHEKACIQHVSVYMEALAGERRELGARAHDAARAAAALSGADPHAPLSRALSHLADLHEKSRVLLGILDHLSSLRSDDPESPIMIQDPQ